MRLSWLSLSWLSLNLLPHLLLGMNPLRFSLLRLLVRALRD
jgi:hypothetical protein